MSQQALADTKIELAQCSRCQRWVFLADSSGMRVAADPAAASRDAYIEALASGRRTFWLSKQTGRPHKLQTRRLTDSAPTFDLRGLQEPPRGSREVLVEHPCAVNARNAVRYEVPEAPKSPAPATPGERRGGLPHATAPVNGGRGPSPAGPASLHPSECGACHKPILEGEGFWGFQHGSTWIYAEHAP